MFEAIRLASDRRQAILGAIITLTLTSTISVTLRLVSKRINRDHLMREDYVVLVAQVYLIPPEVPGDRANLLLDVALWYGGFRVSG